MIKPDIDCGAQDVKGNEVQPCKGGGDINVSGCQWVLKGTRDRRDEKILDLLSHP